MMTDDDKDGGQKIRITNSGVTSDPASTLLPMLVASLVLIFVSMVAVMVFV